MTTVTQNAADAANMIVLFTMPPWLLPLAATGSADALPVYQPWRKAITLAMAVL